MIDAETLKLARLNLLGQKALARVIAHQNPESSQNDDKACVDGAFSEAFEYLEGLEAEYLVSRVPLSDEEKAALMVGDE